ncbi:MULTISPECIES: HEAT repeat domain-containing protein [Prochlorococcus]|uniref:HEAT repeat domain-containing protein n=1 Tax=Prochlorococcus TaxID=1218 RepID=UPI00053399A9|nr:MULTISPECIES: HEAT repeat domain-containing protein [Prochlorococcus]KGG13056.1 Bilin biosynthesis protein CpeZ [Prochlorococcus sp. MIT 0601]
MNRLFKKKADFEALLEAFRHPNPNLNEEACLQMRAYWPKETILFLTNNLDSDDVQIRRKSVKFLSTFGIQIVEPIMNLFISSEKVVLKVSCLKVLIKLAANNNTDDFFTKVFSLIELAIKEDSAEIILSVICLLRQLGKKGLPMLIKLAINTDNILASKAAITAIGEISDTRSINCLNQLLDDSALDLILRESAIYALSNLESN